MSILEIALSCDLGEDFIVMLSQQEGSNHASATA